MIARFKYLDVDPQWGIDKQKTISFCYMVENEKEICRVNVMRQFGDRSKMGAKNFCDK